MGVGFLGALERALLLALALAAAAALLLGRPLSSPFFTASAPAPLTEAASATGAEAVPQGLLWALWAALSPAALSSAVARLGLLAGPVLAAALLLLCSVAALTDSVERL